MKPTRIVATLAATLITIGALAGGAKAAIITVSEDFTSTGVIIVDSSTSTHSFAVSDPSNQDISELTITVNLSGSGELINANGTINSSSNPFMNELVLALISPAGTELALVSAGTYSSGGSGSQLVTLTFADGGLLQSGTDLVPGTFSAAGGSFSVFNGEKASGTWGIRITDTVGADPKSLNGFTLNVTTIPEPSSALLLGLGALSIFYRRRRNR